MTVFARGEQFAPLERAARKLGLAELVQECSALQRPVKGTAPRAFRRGDAPRKTAPSPPLLQSPPRSSETLRDHLLSLLVDEAFADVQLLTTDGEMRASRALLCSRCDYVSRRQHAFFVAHTCHLQRHVPSLAFAPTADTRRALECDGVTQFRALLDGQFKEGRCCPVPSLASVAHAHTPQLAATRGGRDESISALPSVDLRPFGIDVEYATHLLRFIYTGSIAEQLDPNVALVLLPHACALLMEDLKRLCEAALVLEVDEENAASLRELAELHFATRLRYMCNEVMARGAGACDPAGPSLL